MVTRLKLAKLHPSNLFSTPRSNLKELESIYSFIDNRL
jgi:hypothetical protein